MVGELVPPDARRSALRSTVGWVVVGGLVTALGAAWRFTPLPELLDVAHLTRLGSALAAQPHAPAFFLAAYVAGAMRLRLRDFLVGSALGMLPGTVILTTFANRLVATLLHPSPRTVALLGAVVAVLIVILAGVRRIIARRVSSPQGLER